MGARRLDDGEQQKYNHLSGRGPIRDVARMEDSFI